VKVAALSLSEENLGVVGAVNAGAVGRRVLEDHVERTGRSHGINPSLAEDAAVRRRHARVGDHDVGPLHAPPDDVFVMSLVPRVPRREGFDGWPKDVQEMAPLLIGRGLARERGLPAQVEDHMRWL